MASFLRETLRVKNVLFVMFCIQVLVVNSVNISFDETRDVHERVLNFYTNGNNHLKTLIPQEDLSRPINVFLTFHIYSLDRRDTRTGVIELTGSLLAEWTDQTLSSSMGNYSFDTEEGHTVFLPSDVVWTPNIRLNNAAVTHKTSYRSYLLRYNVYDGRIIWSPKMKMAVTCKPDVTHFPFDIHDCDMYFSPHGYSSDEIQLESAQSYLDVCDCTSNGVWEIRKVRTDHVVRNNKSNIKISFQIERKSLLTIIKTICPIILIAILSSCGFLLPPKSSGRMKFTSACFLSFVFIFRTVVQHLPQNADPISSFCYFVLTMMAINACIVIVTVFIQRMYYTPSSESVPTYVQTMTRCIQYCSCKNNCQKDTNTNTADYTDAEASHVTKQPDYIMKPSDFSNIRPSTRMTLASRLSVTTYASSSKDTFITNSDSSDTITWCDVAQSMDRLFFIVFLISQCLISFIFILSLALTSD